VEQGEKPVTVLVTGFGVSIYAVPSSRTSDHMTIRPIVLRNRSVGMLLINP
jgi:hypothetical protein